MSYLFQTYIKMFFLLAPFFGVSMFLKMAEGMDASERRGAAARCSIAVLIATTSFFFFGKTLFIWVGITLPAFQVGAGSTLFVSSMMLVLGLGKRANQPVDQLDDFTVVPLAIPIVVGPGTIGTLLVWGSEIDDATTRWLTFLAVLGGVATVAVFLLTAERIEKLLGQKLLAILTKVSALILVSLAAQIILTGVKSFLDGV